MKSSSALKAVLSLLLVLTLALANAEAATWSCEGVARRYLADPASSVFTNSFGDEVSVNSSGDVLFSSRPARAAHRLYLYDAAGGEEIVASGGDPSPGGGTFGSSRTFTGLSINDAGDLAFFARLDRSRGGVFARLAGGSLESAALSGQAVPGGGTFGSFPGQSAVDASGRVALIGTVKGGSDGVFLYDPNSDALTRELSTGDLAGDGTSVICGFSALALGDVDTALALRGSIAPGGTCGTGEVDAIFIRSQPSSAPSIVAVVGQAAPGGGTFATIAGSTRFHESRFSPSIDSSKNIAFVSEIQSDRKRTTLTQWTAATGALSVVARQTEPLPGTTSPMRSFQSLQLNDNGQVFARVRSKGKGRSNSVASFGAVPAIELAQAATPPTNTNGFYPGARYRKFGSLLSVSRDGTKLALLVKVRDTVYPRSKTGILRCSSN